MASSRESIAPHQPETRLSFNRGPEHPGRGWWWLLLGAALFPAFNLAPYLPDEFEEFPYIATALSPIAILFGIGTLVFRSGVEIDKRRGVVTEWWGFLRPMKRTTYPLAHIDEVELTRVAVRGRHRNHVFYSARLRGTEEPVLVQSEDAYAPVRDTGEGLAAFLGVPLRDEARAPMYTETGEAIETRAPETLHASIAEQRAAAGEALVFPVKPRDCRIEVHRRPNEYTFVLPALRRSWLPAFLVLVIGAAATAGLIWLLRTYVDPEDPLAIRVLLYSFPVVVGLGALAGVFAGINRRVQHEQIVVTPLALRREVKWRVGGRTRELPVEAIEEFGYTPMFAAEAQHANISTKKNVPRVNAAVSARADFGTLWLGQGLRHSERVWLHDAIKYLISQVTDVR